MTVDSEDNTNLDIDNSRYLALENIINYSFITPLM